MNAATEKSLTKYEEKISTLGFQLRDFLLKNIDSITEQPDESANVIGYNYRTGYKDLICTIIPSKKGMKFGFYKGSELPDAAKLLTGSGKVHKFAEINSAKDIANPALKKLLSEAIKAHQNRKG
jgi:Domain of unknown function (DU1801)